MNSNKNFNYKEIPIFINNRNRLTYLKSLINSLEIRGYNNLIILDNDSTYIPLLDFYNNECKHKIVYLNANLGHLALWKSDIFNKYRKNFYVYTDSDLEIINECPENFIEKILIEMKTNLFIQKIGLSLRTDNLPNSYEFKNEVINWEKKFYTIKYKKNNDYFVSHVDTTFAIYRPYAYGGSSEHHLTLRSSYPLTVNHLPWYVDSNNLTEEEQYYIKNATSSTFWTKK